ncbi:hypothetical protein [Streptomyces albidoflavus]|nr:hypothetical protein [Streptomyces albidoflavus]RZD77131.1 hypothetical protein C0Q63_31820 [Streptomyces albidoflavus]
MSVPTNNPDGTASATSSDPGAQVGGGQALPAPLLTTRAALILFGALLAGGTVAMLTYLSAGNAAAAALAGLAGAGVSTTALHGLIGH